MITLLYLLPHWLLGALITGGLIAISLTAYAVFRRVFRAEFSAEDRELSMSVLGVIATITSLLLAFSAVSVWESFGAAEEAVVEEADTVGELARDLAIYGSPDALEAREQLRRYVRLVVEREWEDMRDGRANEEAWRAADDIFRAVGRMDVDTPRREALMPEIWGRTNEILKHRRDRLYRSQAEVPATLWVVVLAGTALTMFTLFVLPANRFNITLVGGVAGAMGLVFFFIIAMDRPFAGTESISQRPFESALDNMDRWDRVSAGSN